MSPTVMIMRRKMAEHYIGLAKEEWDDMYHNASIHDFPYEQNESEIFWDWLEGSCSMMIEDLESDIKEDFGFDWKFYQWGRSGATVAPDLGGMNRYFNRTLDLEDLIGFDPEETDPDQVHDWAKQAKAYYDAFKRINECVKGNVKYIPTAWGEYKSECPEVFEALNQDDEDEDLDEAV